jgi:RNA-binding protein YhbY
MRQNKLIKLTDEELSAELKFELKEMVKETKATESTKIEFIKELKSGLGSEMKQIVGRVTVIKKTRYEKFMVWLKKIFTKF